MPRFNIFKAFTSKGKNPNTSVGVSEQPLGEELSKSRDLPTRKARTLTKRKPRAIAPPIQPSYSVRSEDIGHRDLGRYPSNPKLPEPILADSSNPPNHPDVHPHFEDTRLEYPTTAHESFHPRSQSSKRWSPVPDVYREPPTREHHDDTNRDSIGPHYHERAQRGFQDSPRPSRTRDLQAPRQRRNKDLVRNEREHDRTDAGYQDEIEQSTDSREIQSNTRLADTRGVRYVRDNTVHDRNGALQQGISMRATPLDLSARQPSSSQKSYSREERDPRGRRPDAIEPVVFEHEVLREDGRPNPKVWHYIVPGGMDVIFKDEEGNEITRINNTGDKSNRRRITPMVVEDESGNVIHRVGDVDNTADKSRTMSDQREYPYESRYQKEKNSEPLVRAPAFIKGRPGSTTGHVYTSYLSPEAEKVILIDEQGRQIPIADRRKRGSTRQRRPHDDAGR